MWMFQGNHEQLSALIMSLSSLFLYSFLLIISLRQLLLHRKLLRNNQGGSFIEFKLVFFSVMSASALCSIPLWGGCLFMGCPEKCQWHGAFYYTFWSLHLLALIGFCFCVGIPSIMWSDIINNTQRLHAGASVSFLGSFRRMFTFPLNGGAQLHPSSSYYEDLEGSNDSWLALLNCEYLFHCKCCTCRVDYVRLSFLVFVLCYAVNELIVIASFLKYFATGKSLEDFVENNPLYRVTTYVEPLIIFFFAGNCLFSGITLQIHVRRARFDETKQRKLLTTLNSVLAIVTITYITRAVFVLDLFIEFSNSMTSSYAIWIICTHWMPHLLGSSCLVYIMSQGADKRQQRAKYSKLHVYKGESGRSRKHHSKSSRRSQQSSGVRQSGSRVKSQPGDGASSKTGKDFERSVSSLGSHSGFSEGPDRGSLLDSEECVATSPTSPLLTYTGDSEEFDDDSSVDSRSEEHGALSLVNEDDDDYDSFYDPHYESHSEEGGDFSRFTRVSTLGTGHDLDTADGVFNQ